MRRTAMEKKTMLERKASTVRKIMWILVAIQGIAGQGGGKM